MEVIPSKKILMSLVELMNWWMLIIARYDADRGCDNVAAAVIISGKPTTIAPPMDPTQLCVYPGVLCPIKY